MPDSTDLDAALEEMLGSPITRREHVPTGYTHMERWRVTTADGRRAFVKDAVDDTSAGWLRAEDRMYRALAGAPYLVGLLAFRDGDRPILALEDVGGDHWPPPWRPGDVEAVLATLEQVAATPPPEGLAAVSTSSIVRGWDEVAADPQPFLGIGWAGSAWLDRSLPHLRAAASACDLDGGALLHLDIRSDNLCVRADGRVAIVDWNLAGIGPPRIDVAFWLPSLAAEGGPSPEAVLPDAPNEAALVAGFFASRVGLPIISVAPMVRVVVLRQLAVALPWACRALGIEGPPPLLGAIGRSVGASG
jgi:Phosphotransferase enzyme family